MKPGNCPWQLQLSSYYYYYVAEWLGVIFDIHTLHRRDASLGQLAQLALVVMAVRQLCWPLAILFYHCTLDLSFFAPPLPCTYLQLPSSGLCKLCWRCHLAFVDVPLLLYPTFSLPKNLSKMDIVCFIWNTSKIQERSIYDTVQQHKYRWIRLILRHDCDVHYVT